MNELAIMAETRKFENKGLNTVTKNIFKAGENMTKNAFEIALNLARVENETLFVEDGFKSACEYAEKTFGFKKTKFYNMLSLAEFVDPETKRVILEKKTTDWSVSQISALLPLGSVEEAQSAIEWGAINSDMTVAEIKKAVERINKSTEEPAEESDEEPADDTVDSTCDVATYHFSLSEYEDGHVTISVNGEEIDPVIIDRNYWAVISEALFVKVAGAYGFEK